MKGEIKTEVIGENSFDIEKGGASLAIECQSIFMTLISRKNLNFDDEMTSELILIQKYD